MPLPEEQAERRLGAFHAHERKGQTPSSPVKAADRIAGVRASGLRPSETPRQHRAAMPPPRHSSGARAATAPAAASSADGAAGAPRRLHGRQNPKPQTPQTGRAPHKARPERAPLPSGEHPPRGGTHETPPRPPSPCATGRPARRRAPRRPDS